MTRRFSISTACATVFSALLIISAASAQDNSNAKKASIKNFGCINATYYRGAQPEGSDYADLASMGVKTVIDLQRDGKTDEQSQVESAGMKFFRIPMSDRTSPSLEQAAEFLKIVSDPENQPIFVHCKGGRHRTGAMTAIYRVTHDNWSAAQAYQEMKQYDFGYGMGHGALKDFVFAYYSKMDRSKPEVSVSSVSSSTSENRR